MPFGAVGFFLHESVGCVLNAKATLRNTSWALLTRWSLIIGLCEREWPFSNAKKKVCPITNNVENRDLATFHHF